MTGDDLPDDNHVVRYVKPTSFHEDGALDSSVFILRPRDTGLSVHWLECFDDLTKVQQLAEIRRLSRLTMKANGRLVELNVGETKQKVYDELNTFLRFVHKPSTAKGEYEADPSHSEIIGLPPRDSPQATLLGDLLAECVKATHPARTAP